MPSDGSRVDVVAMPRCSACGREDFASEHALATHMGRSRLCSGNMGLNAIQMLQRVREQERSQSAASAASHHAAAGEEVRRLRYEAEVRKAMLDQLAERRFGRLEGETSIAASKELVTTSMSHVRPELCRRLEPLLQNGSDALVEQTIAEVCDVFGQLKPRGEPAGTCSIFTQHIGMTGIAGMTGMTGMSRDDRDDLQDDHHDFP